PGHSRRAERTADRGASGPATALLNAPAQVSTGLVPLELKDVEAAELEPCQQRGPGEGARSGSDHAEYSPEPALAEINCHATDGTRGRAPSARGRSTTQGRSGVLP